MLRIAIEQPNALHAQFASVAIKPHDNGANATVNIFTNNPETGEKGYIQLDTLSLDHATATDGDKRNAYLTQVVEQYINGGVSPAPAVPKPRKRKTSVPSEA